MTSERQKAANRQNALRSTGPSTTNGKDMAKMNALKHGLRAETLVLPDEDPAEFERFRDSLIEELTPGGELEGVLVARIVTFAWRLRRVGQIEAGIFIRHHYQELARRAQDKAWGVNPEGNGSNLSRLLADIEATQCGRIEEDTAPNPDVQAAEDAAQTALSASRPVLVAFDGRLDPLANVSRYETTLERSLFRALHELERLEARRAGQEVAPPAVLDVNLDVQQDAS